MRYLFLSTLCTLVVFLGYGQGNAKFSGKISWSNYAIQPKVKVMICKDLKVFHSPDTKFIEIPTSSTGEFSFSLDSVPLTGMRIFLDDGNGTTVINGVIVKPGDSIYMRYSIDQPSSSSNFGAGKRYPKYINFTGNGSLKYEVTSKIFAINTDPITHQIEGFSTLPIEAEKLVEKRMAILKSYNKKLTKDEYKSIYIDMIAMTKDAFIHHIFLSPYRKPSDTDESYNNRKSIYSKLLTIADRLASDEELASSPFSECYLESRLTKEYSLNHSGVRADFATLYDYAKAKLSGKVKERVLYSLANTMVFYDIQDPELYNKVFAEVFSLLTIPEMKSRIKNTIDTRKKGALPLNLSLPADSSGKMVSLSDFKGKVILIDMYSSICSACYKFANVFHNEVYPLFKVNPNFQVVTVMKSGSKKAFKIRLRGEPISPDRAHELRYVFPEYTNLYADPATAGKAILEHYSAYVNPFVLIIGKDGKIFSGNPPFFTESGSPNIQKMKELIQAALDE